MEKSQISVSNTLMLILIVIIIIGFSAVASQLTIVFNMNMCIKSQVKAVNDIEGLVEEIREMGVPVIEFLEVHGACTECIWYNVSFEKVEIKFKTMSTSYSVDVSMPWQWAAVSDATESKCDENTNAMKPGTYTIEVHPNYIDCQDCE